MITSLRAKMQIEGDPICFPNTLDIPSFPQKEKKGKKNKNQIHKLLRRRRTRVALQRPYLRRHSVAKRRLYEGSVGNQRTAHHSLLLSV